jgi:hypothetical protein
MWLDGYPVSQTLLTCHYLHQESASTHDDKAFYALVLLLLRCYHALRANLERADIYFVRVFTNERPYCYQEEEFSRTLSNWSFWMPIDDKQLLEMLADAEAHLKTIDGGNLHNFKEIPLNQFF